MNSFDATWSKHGNNLTNIFFFSNQKKIFLRVFCYFFPSFIFFEKIFPSLNSKDYKTWNNWLQLLRSWKKIWNVLCTKEKKVSIGRYSLLTSYSLDLALVPHYVQNCLILSKKYYVFATYISKNQIQRHNTFTKIHTIFHYEKHIIIGILNPCWFIYSLPNILAPW